MQPEPPEAVEPPPLRRQPEFLKLWAGQTISVFGDQVTVLALPLAAVLTLNASAFQMGVLTAVAWLPHLLLSLHVGLFIDRRGNRRQTMIAADLSRAVVLASIPLAYAFDALTMPQLYAVAFAVGAISVFFDLVVEHDLRRDRAAAGLRRGELEALPVPGALLRRWACAGGVPRAGADGAAGDPGGRAVVHRLGGLPLPAVGGRAGARAARSDAHAATAAVRGPLVHLSQRHLPRLAARICDGELLQPDVQRPVRALRDARARRQPGRARHHPRRRRARRRRRCVRRALDLTADRRRAGADARDRPLPAAARSRPRRRRPALARADASS